LKFLEKIAGFVFKNKFLITGIMYLSIIFYFLFISSINLPILAIIYVIFGFSIAMIILLIYFFKIDKKFIKNKRVLLINPTRLPKLYRLKNNIENDHIILLDNGKTLSALAIFRIASIPLGIQSNLKKFIRSMADNNLCFFRIYDYSFVSVNEINNNNDRYLQWADDFPELFLNFHDNIPSRMEKWKTEILYGCFYKLKGNLNEKNIQKVYNIIDTNLLIMKSIFSNAFAHVEFEILPSFVLYKIIRNISACSELYHV